MNFLVRLLSPRLRKRRHLRALIRGYAGLKRGKCIGLGRHLKSALAQTRLSGITGHALPMFFGAGTANAERVVRQYLFERHVGTAMNRAVLHALGSKSAVVFALPPEWRRILIEHGLNVDARRSALAWRWSLVLHFGRNILSLGQTLLRLLAAQGQPLPQDRYAFFDGLSAGNLPYPDSNGRSYDICSWYAQWNGRISGLASIRHNVQQPARAVGSLRVESVAAPFLLLRGGLNILGLWGWCFGATAIAMFDLLRGRWWHALMLAEAARAKAVAMCPAEALAADYLFHFSGTMYRPLWTYAAEAKGARIVCYFYSTFEQPQLAMGYESQQFEWGGASWPLYLVWDQYQEAQLRRDMGDEPQILVVGPIWFSTAQKDALRIPEKTVAVFDVEALRPSMHFPFTTMGDYIAALPDYSELFLWDIQKVLEESGLNMAFKKKREIGRRGSKSYDGLVREISNQNNVLMVPSDHSALHVIQDCIGVISMPFTSTALYLREQNIPSIYYDPTGWFQKQDRAAHGIPVLQGIHELRAWVNECLNTSESKR